MVLRSGPEAFGYTFVKPTDDEEKGQEQADDKAAHAAEEDTDDIEVGAAAAAATAGGDGGDVISCATDLQVEVNDEGLAKSKNDDKKKQAVKKEQVVQEKQKPYIYIPTTPSSKKTSPAGNKNNNTPDDASAAAAMESYMCLSGMGACCCCLTILLVVAGAILFATEAYLNSVNQEEEQESTTRMSYAAIICMILGGGTCLFACCTCLTSCCTLSGLVAQTSDSSGGSGGPWEDANKEVRVSFKRHNDRYIKAEELLESVHFNALKDVKGISEAEKKETRQKKEEEKKKKNELEKQVKKDLEAGLTVKEIRRNYRPCAFVIRFNGDVMLHDAAELLRKQVGIVVNCARPGLDQAVIVITSPGGAVSSYGLAASQLIRLRKAGIKLVACVDTVAASGGYMLAACADVIYAAPFSVIGSIGVVTQIPNVQRFLNKHDIDAYLFTAGKHKRTIDIIGDVTDEGKAKLQEELDEIHRAFKDHIALARPKVRESIEDIATGEYWLAVHAKEKGLVDDILTSDEYLESIAKEHEIIELVEKKKKSALSGLFGPGGSAAQSLKDFLVNSFGAAAAASTIGRPTTPMAIA